MTAFADARALRQFGRFARETGLALDSILDEDLRAVLRAAETEERVPAHAIIDMMQICATVGRRPDLGMAFAAWINMRGLGPLSLLWDHCSTLAEALRVNERFLHIESAALGAEIEDRGEELACKQFLLVPARYGGSQFLQGTITLELRVARLILGDDWSPVRLELSCSAPESARYQQSIYRCPIEFGADCNALIIRKSDMHRQSRGGNPEMLAYLERHLQSLDTASPVELPQQVAQVIAARLAQRRASLLDVASALAMSPRTLQRRLIEGGTTFGAELAKVRQTIATDYFMTEARPCLNQLAYRLGYSDESAVSRHLKTRLGTGARAMARAGVRASTPS